MPAIPSSIIEPVWDQFQALLPPPANAHPLGCHHPRIPDRVVFDKLVQILVFGCAYERIADADCSATTLRRRRDEWIDAGVMETLRMQVIDAFDRMIGLALEDLAVDGCITEAPCGGEESGRSPVDRGKQGRKRSTVVEGQGLPLGTVIVPAARHDSPLLDPTLDTVAALGPLPEGIVVHLDRGYDSALTRTRLATRGLGAQISPKGMPAPLAASQRWVIETHACLDQRAQKAGLVHRTAATGDRLLACACGRDPDRATAHPPRMATLPVGRAPTSLSLTPAYWCRLKTSTLHRVATKG